MSDMFNDIEDAFGLPTGSTKMTKTRMKNIGTAIAKKTLDIEKEVNDLERIDIMKDGSLELREKVLRGKEYLRREAIETYEMTRDAVNMLKSELMPGAAASMWLAYSNLIKALNDCHSKIESIYHKLDEELGLVDIPDEYKEKNDNTVITDTDALMDLIEKSKINKNAIDVSDILNTVDINIDEENDNNSE